MNFLWSGTDGNVYVGTAGHCLATSSVATDATGARIGTFVFREFTQGYDVVREPINALLDDLSGMRDFALIRLDPGVAYSPELCHFGGPAGRNDDIVPLTQPVLMHHFGHGIAVSDAFPARTMVSAGMPSATLIIANAVITPRDSGSPVITADGRAVGIATAISPGHQPSPGTSWVMRLAEPLVRAQAALKTSLTLVTAPLRPTCRL